MAGGWARDGAVNEQIDASIEDELKRLQARRAPQGESAEFCVECDEPIPEARRSNMRHRPIGIGVQGLADAFILMRHPFDSVEAKVLNREIELEEIDVTPHMTRAGVGKGVTIDKLVANG